MRISSKIPVNRLSSLKQLYQEPGNLLEDKQGEKDKLKLTLTGVKTDGNDLTCRSHFVQTFSVHISCGF